MGFSVATVLLLSALAMPHTFASALPGSVLEPRSCGTKIYPRSIYGIDTDSDRTSDRSDFQPPNHIDFFTTQETRTYDDGTSEFSESDMIATFTDIPCPPTGKDPYRLEFLFQVPSISSYGYDPRNSRIDVWAINGELPKNSTGGDAPTWNNMRDKTGSKVGVLNMPQGSNQVYQILKVKKGLTCQPTLNFRLSITNDGGNKTGFVRYDMVKGTDGLRIRYGC